ncbi:MAG: RsmE family RNA methyltransferase [bacterium]|nr:RsmE family RNA methyltransferase [bacterium]
MGYFLADLNLVLDQAFRLEGEEAAHLLQSRRIRADEELEIQDPTGQRFLCRVLARERRSLELLPQRPLTPPAEPEFKLYLHQAMVKEKALDFILQKATELGAAGIYLFESEHSQRLPEGRDREKKEERWQKILWEACKQSGRQRPPELGLEETSPLVSSFSEPCFVLDPYHEGPLLKDLALEGAARMLLGPEGGFAQEELAGFQGQYLKLGPRVLRADTAALAGLSLFGAYFGDLH